MTLSQEVNPQLISWGSQGKRPTLSSPVMSGSALTLPDGWELQTRCVPQL